MRVFVASTGRSGTCTFYQACRHLTNYTVGHESAAGGIGRLDYPDQHVEVSCALAWEMPLVIRQYPGATWVHLVRRDREACARSLAENMRQNVERWTRRWRRVAVTGDDLLLAAGSYYDAVNALVASLLPAASLTLVTEDVSRKSWGALWNTIGGQGDFEASLAEWTRRYNTTQRRGRDRWDSRSGQTP